MEKEWGRGRGSVRTAKGQRVSRRDAARGCYICAMDNKRQEERRSSLLLASRVTSPSSERRTPQDSRCLPHQTQLALAAARRPLGWPSWECQACACRPAHSSSAQLSARATAHSRPALWPPRAPPRAHRPTSPLPVPARTGSCLARLACPPPTGAAAASARCPRASPQSRRRKSRARRVRWRRPPAAPAPEKALLVAALPCGLRHRRGMW
eukprot:scaffold13454_cov114-Isochrysis_galbana.AAC.5